MANDPPVSLIDDSVRKFPKRVLDNNLLWVAYKHKRQTKLKQKKKMLVFSYREVFLFPGATAAVIGPKDLPAVARTIGRFVGHAVGYVQFAHGQFESVMQQFQACQVHKELKKSEPGFLIQYHGTTILNLRKVLFSVLL